MIGRVTSQTMLSSSLSNLQTSARGLAKLQEQASSQKAISRPSDDPAATADALQIRAAQKANLQFGRNITDGNGWLNTIDSALSSTTSLLGRARDLTVQGANDGSMSPLAKEAIAKALETIRDSMLHQANTTYLGRTVFAGSSDAGFAFDASFSFTGVAGSSVERRVNEGQTVRVDIDGSQAFGEGADSMFGEVQSVIDDLRAGVNVSSHLAALDDRLQSLLGAHGQIGARQSAVETAIAASGDRQVLLENQRAGVEDVDTARVFMELQMQTTVYQASLAVTAQTLQKNLMDFIR
jgi:flagellar hook-associated protein 3 FlgL